MHVYMLWNHMEWLEVTEIFSTCAHDIFEWLFPRPIYKKKKNILSQSTALLTTASVLQDLCVYFFSNMIHAWKISYRDTCKGDSYGITY